MYANWDHELICYLEQHSTSSVSIHNFTTGLFRVALMRRGGGGVQAAAPLLMQTCEQTLLHKCFFEWISFWGCISGLLLLVNCMSHGREAELTVL